MKVCAILVWATLCLGALSLYSDTEFHLIMSLCKFFNIGFIVFVRNETSSPHLIDEMKRTSAHSVASSSLTPEQLEAILISDLKSNGFLRRRTMVATKRSIRLGHYLQLNEHPELVVWALFVDPVDVTTVGSLLPYDGRVFRISRQHNRLMVHEWIHSQKGKPIQNATFGYVPSESRDVHFPEYSAYLKQKMNLTNLVLKIGISSDPCRKGKDGYLLQMLFCYHSMILDIMAEKMNFTKIAVPYIDGNYSFVYPNGSYSGFFKMILDKKVDLSVAGFVITERRMNHFEFIWPTFAFETMLYLKKADGVTAALTGTPFSTSVWAATWAWVVLVGGLLQLSNHCRNECETTMQDATIQLCHSVFKIMQLISNQGSEDTPHSITNRILYSITLFAGMLLCYYYSATVLSFLTIDDVDVPFSNLQGFTNNGKYKLIATADGFSSYYVRFEMTGHMAWKFMVRTEELPIGIEQGVKQLCDGQRLTLLEVKGTMLSVKDSKCQLIEVPTPVFHQFFGFAATKPSKVAKYFTLILRRVNEVGIIERMRQNLSKFDDIKALHEDTGYNSVTIEQTTKTFLILQFGVSLSVIVLMFEAFRFRARRKDKIPKTGNPYRSTNRMKMSRHKGQPFARHQRNFPN